MEFDPPLIEARLIRRYKRFLADVIMPDGSELTVHTPNTGSMLGCAIAGNRVWLRDTQNPKRKYRYSWEMSEGEGGTRIGVHTGIVNRLVREALDKGLLESLRGYPEVAEERPYGSEGSRIDLLLSGHATAPDVYVEIKNVTACDEADSAIFPDAVTLRGQKHLRELMGVVGEGGRAVLLFCVQREDVVCVRPAEWIDPHYAALLRKAEAAGVELLALRARLSTQAIELDTPIPVVV